MSQSEYSFNANHDIPIFDKSYAGSEVESRSEAHSRVGDPETVSTHRAIDAIETAILLHPEPTQETPRPVADHAVSNLTNVLTEKLVGEKKDYKEKISEIRIETLIKVAKAAAALAGSVIIATALMSAGAACCMIPGGAVLLVPAIIGASLTLGGGLVIAKEIMDSAPSKTRKGELEKFEQNKTNVNEALKLQQEYPKTSPPTGRSFEEFMDRYKNGQGQHVYDVADLKKFTDLYKVTRLYNKEYVHADIHDVESKLSAIKLKLNSSDLSSDDKKQAKKDEKELSGKLGTLKKELLETSPTPAEIGTRRLELEAKYISAAEVPENRPEIPANNQNRPEVRIQEMPALNAPNRGAAPPQNIRHESASEREPIDLSHAQAYSYDENESIDGHGSNAESLYDEASQISESESFQNNIDLSEASYVPESDIPFDLESFLAAGRAMIAEQQQVNSPSVDQNNQLSQLPAELETSKQKLETLESKLSQYDSGFVALQREYLMQESRALSLADDMDSPEFDEALNKFDASSNAVKYAAEQLGLSPEESKQIENDARAHINLSAIVDELRKKEHAGAYVSIDSLFDKLKAGDAAQTGMLTKPAQSELKSAPKVSIPNKNEAISHENAPKNASTAPSPQMVLEDSKTLLKNLGVEFDENTPLDQVINKKIDSLNEEIRQSLYAQEGMSPEDEKESDALIQTKIDLENKLKPIRETVIKAQKEIKAQESPPTPKTKPLLTLDEKIEINKKDHNETLAKLKDLHIDPFNAQSIKKTFELLNTTNTIESKTKAAQIRGLTNELKRLERQANDYNAEKLKLEL